MVLSSHPSDAIIDTGFSFDSLLKEALHLIEFAILYILVIMAILTFGELASGASRLAAIWAIAYGFLDEFHQYFVPSRSATVIDLVKDTVGVLIVYYWLKSIILMLGTTKSVLGYIELLHIYILMQGICRMGKIDIKVLLKY